MMVAIRYVDGPRLARSLIAATDRVAVGREERTRISVFPVSDGDTGTSFTLTLHSVADALRALGDASLGSTAPTAARGAVLGALGNSSMRLAHGDILKVHVRPHVPDAVFTYAARWGTIDSTKALENRLTPRPQRVRFGIVHPVLWHVEAGMASQPGGG